MPIPIQIGLPELPESGSDAFFAILNGWLEDCAHGSRHNECQASSTVKLPTRLIDVGIEEEPILRLVESASDTLLSSPYIALSHRWVLQERALARRTIYFAENQTYFECGRGIQCESMTNMHK